MAGLQLLLVAAVSLVHNFIILQNLADLTITLAQLTCTPLLRSCLLELRMRMSGAFQSQTHASLPHSCYAERCLRLIYSLRARGCVRAIAVRSIPPGANIMRSHPD